jgi:hypothetical protein
MPAQDGSIISPVRYWHTTPLHYIPHLLQSGALLSKARLLAAGSPIRPRPTAVRRDRKLGLADYVHLSLVPRTPLLAHKRAHGFPHLLLEFDAAVADLPGAAYLPFNTKSWRHRDDFVPITAPEAKAAFVAAWRSGKYPSAELLVPGALPLTPHAWALHAATEPEAEWIHAMAAAVSLTTTLLIRVSPEHFPHSPAPDLGPHHAYLSACALVGRVLPPPDLPFD